MISTSPIKNNSKIRTVRSNNRIDSSLKPSSPRAPVDSSSSSRSRSRLEKKGYIDSKTSRSQNSPIKRSSSPRSVSNPKPISPRAKLAGTGPRVVTSTPRSRGFNSPASPRSPKSPRGRKSPSSPRTPELQSSALTTTSPEDEVTVVDMDPKQLSEMYNAIIAKHNVKDLRKRTFSLLIKKAKPFLGVTYNPSEQDLYSSFDLADLNNDGKVTLEEFLQFSTLLSEGERNGFDTSKNISMCYTKQRDLMANKRAARKSIERSGLNEALALSKPANITPINPGSSLLRKRTNSENPDSDEAGLGLYRSRRSGSLTSRSRDAQGVVSTRSRARSLSLTSFDFDKAEFEDRGIIQTEEFNKMQGYKGRGLMSNALTVANDDWTTRTANGTVTVVSELGRFANETTSTRNHVEARKLKEDFREEVSMSLTKARDDFNKRMSSNLALRGHSATGFDRLGAFTKETSTSRNRENLIEPQTELALRHRRCSRDDMGQDLALAREAWEERKENNELHTQVDELGTFSHATLTSANKEDIEKPHAEAHIWNKRYSRDIGARDLALENEAWKDRQKNNTLHTQIEALGDFARATLTSANKEDIEKPHAEAHIWNKRFSRNIGASDLALANAMWKERQEKNELGTEVATLGDFARPTLTSANKGDETMPGNENIEHMALNGRNLASQHLAKQNLEWQERQKTGSLFTLVDDLGTFAARTLSSTHRDDNTGELPTNESIKNMRRNSRIEASEQLAKDKLEWNTRKDDKALETKTLQLGHFASPTESTTNSDFGEYMKDLNLFVWGDENGKKNDDLRLMND